MLSASLPAKMPAKWRSTSLAFSPCCASGHSESGSVQDAGSLRELRHLHGGIVKDCALASGPILGGSLVLCGDLHPCGHGMVLSPSHVRGSRFRDNEAIVTQRWRSRFRFMNSAMNERRKDVSHFAIFFRGCACNPQDSGIERYAVRAG
jgi:hypothetical protein